MDDEPEFADEQGERQGFNIDIIIGKAVFSVFPPLKHNTKHIHNQNNHRPLDDMTQLTQHKGPLVSRDTCSHLEKPWGLPYNCTSPNYSQPPASQVAWSLGVGLAI